MNPKTWNDQPDAVEKARILCRNLEVKGRFCEVRKMETGEYLLTAGNLFGSQTIKCANADVVFAVFGAAQKKELNRLPEGAELME